MSYLVIARKWRPNLFSEVVGQEHVTRTLENAVSSGRIAHAYIFSGPRGVGKTTAARILARAINCKSGPTPTPCNACEICTSITDGSSVDVIEIDGASNTSVENIRELRDGIKYMPQSTRYKVYIIDEVHMLSTSAFNALLKTLEEPPPHAVFIFATTEVHKIPQTILSRCQRFDFKRISFKDITSHLAYIANAEEMKVEDGVFELLAREAEGSMRDAESLFDQVIAFAGTDIKEQDAIDALGLMDRSILFDLSSAVLEGDGKKLLNIIEKVYGFGYDFKKVCLELLEHVRDLTVLKVTGDDALLELPPSEAERLKRIAESASIEGLQMVFGVISKGYEDIARSSTPRFALEMTLLRASSIEDLSPIGEVIDRLKALRGSSGPQAQAAPARSAPSLRPAPEVAKRKAPHQGEARTETRAEARPKAPAPPAKELTTAAKEEGARYGGESSERAAGDLADLGAFIVGKKRSLAGHLSDATFELKGDLLDISVTKPVGFLRAMEGEIEGLCREFLNKKVTINLVECVGGEGGKGGAMDALVDDAVKILGGKIIEDRRAKDV